MGWLLIVNYTGCKGGGWLIMVDVSYTTLHKRTSEWGWLATLSTPLDQPLVLNDAKTGEQSIFSEVHTCIWNAVRNLKNVSLCVSCGMVFEYDD